MSAELFRRKARYAADSSIWGDSVGPPAAKCLGHHCWSGPVEPRLETVPQSEPTPPIDIHQNDIDIHQNDKEGM